MLEAVILLPAPIGPILSISLDLRLVLRGSSSSISPLSSMPSTDWRLLLPIVVPRLIDLLYFLTRASPWIVL